MEESFLVQFYNKSVKAHEISSKCFMAQDYIGFFTGYLEEGYYRLLSSVSSGHEDQTYRDETGKVITIADNLRLLLLFGQNEQSKTMRALKKMGKLDKIPELDAAIGRFIDEIVTDFITLSRKSVEIYNTLMGMKTWEKMEKGLTWNVNNPINPVNKLIMDDDEAAAALNRRSDESCISQLVQEIQEIIA